MAIETERNMKKPFEEYGENAGKSEERKKIRSKWNKKKMVETQITMRGIKTKFAMDAFAIQKNKPEFKKGIKILIFAGLIF